jgi:hypothetical protein
MNVPWAACLSVQPCAPQVSESSFLSLLSWVVTFLLFFSFSREHDGVQTSDGTLDEPAGSIVGVSSAPSCPFFATATQTGTLVVWSVYPDLARRFSVDARATPLLISTLRGTEPQSLAPSDASALVDVTPLPDHTVHSVHMLTDGQPMATAGIVTVFQVCVCVCVCLSLLPSLLIISVGPGRQRCVAPSPHRLPGQGLCRRCRPRLVPVSFHCLVLLSFPSHPSVFILLPPSFFLLPPSSFLLPPSLFLLPLPADLIPFSSLSFLFFCQGARSASRQRRQRRCAQPRSC